jgi:hypothetical protein
LLNRISFQLGIENKISNFLFSQHYFRGIIYIGFAIRFRDKRNSTRSSWIGFNDINYIVFYGKARAIFLV